MWEGQLAISVTDAEHAGRLPGTHRDPLDRMLAAQALAREVCIVSVDPIFDQFGDFGKQKNDGHNRIINEK